MSSGPVLAGGIDFSFTHDAFHARSTPGYRDMENRSNRFKSLINTNAVYSDGTFSTVSKSGRQVRSSLVMRNYRDLFEEEFGGNPRLLDIEGSGLNLGVKTISIHEAFSILEGDAAFLPDKYPKKRAAQVQNPGHKERIAAFALREIETLRELKEILTGDNPPARLETLLDTADYLWAHFPECAAANRRPPATDISFIKRVRMEIEPFIKLWEMTLEELANPGE